MREPVFAGAFYPYDPEELRKTIKGFLGNGANKRDVIGAVAPHAGYAYCGKTAASVYGAIAGGFETAVVLGPNHSGTGSGIAVSSDSWKTPLGTVKSDKEFAKELVRDSIIAEDETAHSREHSIEVQLPWLQFLFRDFRIVPISVSPAYFDIDSCKEIGDKITEAADRLKRKILIIASSDFTHYGHSYGYLPFVGGDVAGKIKELDMKTIGLVEKLDAEKVIRASYEKGLTICGYGAIASMLFAAKKLGAKKGKLMDYSTSFDISKNLDAIVGYAGLIIY